MSVVNIGDVIATLIVLLFAILIVTLVVLVIKRLTVSSKEKKMINRKLDTILEKLDEQKKR